MKESRSLGPPWASRLSRCHEPFLPAPDPCCAVLVLLLRWLLRFRPGVPQSPWLGCRKGCSLSPAGGWGWYTPSSTVPRACPGRGFRGGMPQRTQGFLCFTGIYRSKCDRLNLRCVCLQSKCSFCFAKYRFFFQSWSFGIGCKDRAHNTGLGAFLGALLGRFLLVHQ